jgi:hypothetical protein
LTLAPFFGALVRQIGAGERIAGELNVLGDSLVGFFVELARSEGCSWTDIGAPRGLSRQGEQQRYAPLLAQLTIDDLIRSGVLQRFNDEALGCLRHAQTRAGELGHDAIDTADLLVAVLDDPAGLAGTVIRELGGDPSEVRATLEQEPDDDRARPDPRARRASDAGPGMTALRQVVDALEALPTTAFLVLNRGQIVLEYGATTAPSFLASARKSVLSVLYGPAVADGTIRLSANLGELGIDDIGGLQPQERRATVRDLLTSSSGVYHPPATVAGPEEDAPARGTQPPGALFLYNNWRCCGPRGRRCQRISIVVGVPAG